MYLCFEPFVPNAAKQPFRPVPVTDPQQVEVGVGPHVFAQGVKEVIVSLEFREPGDRAHQAGIGRQSEPGSGCRFRFGVIEEGIDHHATANRGVLLRPSDAPGHCLVAHGVGYGHDVMASPGGVPFRQHVREVANT